MRLSEFIEGKPTSITDQLLNLGISKRYIEECKKAGKFLLRGSEKRIDSYQYIVPRTDRKPSGMSELSQKMLDDMFHKRFGWRPRSEGVFTTSTMSSVEIFGLAYIFIPENDNFKFVWAPYIHDINYNDDFNKLDHEIFSKAVLNHKRYPTFNIKDYEKEFDFIVSQYRDDKLSTAIKSGNEVSFKISNGYYLVNYNNHHQELQGELFTMSDKMRKFFNEGTEPKKWMGSKPSKCDLCSASIDKEFYDAKTRQGQWGNMCPKCFKQHGVGVGTGKGQHYVKNTGGEYEKTEG